MKVLTLILVFFAPMSGFSDPLDGPSLMAGVYDHLDCKIQLTPNDQTTRSISLVMSEGKGCKSVNKKIGLRDNGILCVNRSPTANSDSYACTFNAGSAYLTIRDQSTFYFSPSDDSTNLMEFKLIDPDDSHGSE